MARISIYVRTNNLCISESITYRQMPGSPNTLPFILEIEGGCLHFGFASNNSTHRSTEKGRKPGICHAVSVRFFKNTANLSLSHLQSGPDSPAAHRRFSLQTGTEHKPLHLTQPTQTKRPITNWLRSAKMARSPFLPIGVHSCAFVAKSLSQMNQPAVRQLPHNPATVPAHQTRTHPQHRRKPSATSPSVFFPSNNATKSATCGYHAAYFAALRYGNDCGAAWPITKNDGLPHGRRRRW